MESAGHTWIVRGSCPIKLKKRIVLARVIFVVLKYMEMIGRFVRRSD